MPAVNTGTLYNHTRQGALTPLSVPTEFQEGLLTLTLPDDPSTEASPINLLDVADQCQFQGQGQLSYPLHLFGAFKSGEKLYELRSANSAQAVELVYSPNSHSIEGRLSCEGFNLTISTQFKTGWNLLTLEETQGEAGSELTQRTLPFNTLLVWTVKP
ncbi:hypothetical protein [Deinococcus cellulosilyticus]|nr:hypothetical protein [Deinococcus cellulosilyticus]